MSCVRPSGDWGSLPLEGGIEAAYKRQFNSAPTPEAREELMSELLAKFEEVRSPMKTAHSFGVEEIIDPRDTRPLACEVSSFSTITGLVLKYISVDLARVRTRSTAAHLDQANGSSCP